MRRFALLLVSVSVLLILVGCQQAPPTLVSTLSISNIPQTETGYVLFVREECNPVYQCAANLWRMRIDGMELQQLTFDEAPGIGYYLSEDVPVSLFIASESSVMGNGVGVREVIIPESCRESPYSGEGADRVFDFKFSPSGRYMSFTVGEGMCGGAVLRILDQQTQTCIDVPSNDRLIEWGPDDRAIVAMATCSGSPMVLYDVRTKEEVAGLGLYGGYVNGWNETHTVAWGQRDNIAFGWWLRGFWAYNLAANVHIHPTVFNSDQNSFVMDLFEGWGADETQLLYSRRLISYTYGVTESTVTTVTMGPREIHSVDILGRESKLLLGDPLYSYFVRGYDSECLVIQRIPYEPYSLPARSPYFKWEMLQQCAYSGEACPESEYFLVDVLSGRLLSSTTPLSATVVASQPMPDLDSAPVYQAEDGDFALHTGIGGVGLWRVSLYQTLMLIEDGHHFVYVPME